MARSTKASSPLAPSEAEDILASLKQRREEYEIYFAQQNEKRRKAMDNSAIRAYLSLVKMICAMSVASVGTPQMDAEAMRRVAGRVLEEVYGIKPLA